MNVFIVYAHPEPKSFNGAMKDLAVQVLRQEGHVVHVSDLYAKQFDAAGGPGDFVQLRDQNFFNYLEEQVGATQAGSFVPELKEEMDKVVWADLLIFQFPLWWFSLPAILKGWVDRVFAMGFSYEIRRNFENGIFRGKRAMLSLTTGSPEFTYGPKGKLGNIHHLIHHIQYGMLYYVGMDVLPPFIAYAAGHISPEQRAVCLKAYKERLLALDTTAPLALRAVDDSL